MEDYVATLKSDSLKGTLKLQHKTYPLYLPMIASIYYVESFARSSETSLP